MPTLTSAMAMVRPNQKYGSCDAGLAVEPATEGDEGEMID